MVMPGDPDNHNVSVLAVLGSNMLLAYIVGKGLPYLSVL